MKNISTYIMISIVSLVLVVATAFLMTAADAPIREAGGYLPLLLGTVLTRRSAATPAPLSHPAMPPRNADPEIVFSLK